jgi:hypothetical protein
MAYSSSRSLYKWRSEEMFSSHAFINGGLEDEFFNAFGGES